MLVTETERGKGSEDIAGIDTGQGLHPVTESIGDGGRAQGAGTGEDMITNDIGTRIAVIAPIHEQETLTTTADISLSPNGD